MIRLPSSMWFWFPKYWPVADVWLMFWPRCVQERSCLCPPFSTFPPSAMKDSSCLWNTGKIQLIWNLQYVANTKPSCLCGCDRVKSGIWKKTWHRSNCWCHSEPITFDLILYKISCCTGFVLDDLFTAETTSSVRVFTPVPEIRVAHFHVFSWGSSGSSE